MADTQRPLDPKLARQIIEVLEPLLRSIDANAHLRGKTEGHAAVRATVEALHAQGTGADAAFCQECGLGYPCPTIRALSEPEGATTRT